jgi:hypothetical protein
MIREQVEAPLIGRSTIADPALIGAAEGDVADPASGGPDSEAERGHLMRTRHLMAGLLAVTLAACTSGASSTPSPEPTVAPAPQATPTAIATPEPASTPAPTSTTAALSVKVTFDGEACTYIGPMVIPDGTVVRFEFVPDQEVLGASLIVYGIRPGTTYQDLLDSIANSDADDISIGIPDWVYQPTATWTQGASTMLYTVERVKHGSDGVDYTVGGYHVMCDTPKGYPAAQLSVAGA